METVPESVKNYQCVGCVGGPPESGCYKRMDPGEGLGCGSHVAGTMISNIGSIFLGMPVGFNRIGPRWDYPQGQMRMHIYQLLGDVFSGTGYDYLNLPVWKHKTDEGHILVRGIHPRRNLPFLHVILDGSEFDQIKCHEITKEDMVGMD